MTASTERDDSDLGKLLLPWGKWGSQDSPYPLVAHLLDTSAVASVLWDHWVSTSFKNLIHEYSPYTDIADTGKWVSYVAGLHDLGKSEPIFQGQLKSRQESSFATQVEEMSSLGFPFPTETLENNMIGSFIPQRSQAGKWRYFRHEARTGEYLDFLGEETGWVKAALAGHHGKYHPYSRSPVNDHYCTWLQGTPWLGLNSQIVDYMKNACGINNLTSSEEQALFWSVLAAPFLTGFVVLSDWIASDDSYVAASDISLLSCPDKYLEEKKKLAYQNIGDWLGWSSAPEGLFEELFDGFKPERSCQQWVQENGDKEESSLTVITVPMGEGKTEAALYLHSKFYSHNKDGILFALPTMATANSIFDRVKTFYNNSVHTRGNLAHSQSILNSFYSSESTSSPQEICDESPHETGISPSSWFKGPHRSLSAPVTVSTCDQVLSVALSHKYLPMRLASLASKHLILDEVHTYDPYQHILLCRVLEWLSFAGGRVTILTATLPTSRLSDYIKHWQKGQEYRKQKTFDAGGDIDVPNPSIDKTYPSVSTVSKNGVVVQQKLDTIRRYAHTLEYARVPDNFDSRVLATVDIVSKLAKNNPEAKIGVILNIVNRAIEVSELLDAQGYNVKTFHSRMTYKQKEDRLAEVLSVAGKHSSSGPVIVVGTQIMEASLDLDFDFLISDMSPAPSLLQRMGRQWRHSVPSPNGSWIHPDSRHTVRENLSNPHMIVLVPISGEQTHFSKNSSLPYTKAELNTTYQALEFGNMHTIRIPEDLQNLVDEAEVSWATLIEMGEEEDSNDNEHNDAVYEHKAHESMSKRKAYEAGVNLEDFNSWNPAKWINSHALYRMTEGTLWSEEAQTRLRDTLSLHVLVYDSSGTNTYALSGDLNSLKNKNHSLQEMLGCIIAVNGRVARDLKEIANPPEWWNDEMPILLRDVVPVSLQQLGEAGKRGYLLEDELGLCQKGALS